MTVSAGVSARATDNVGDGGEVAAADMTVSAGVSARATDDVGDGGEVAAADMTVSAGCFRGLGRAAEDGDRRGLADFDRVRPFNRARPFVPLVERQPPHDGTVRADVRGRRAAAGPLDRYSHRMNIR